MLRLACVLCFLAACQAPTLELEVPLAAVNWSPQDGASGVCPDWPVSVCFNQPIATSSLNDFLIGTAETCDAGAAIAASAGLTAIRADTLNSRASPDCVVMSPPASGWNLGTCYTVEVEGQDLVSGGGAAGELSDGGLDFLAVTLRSIFEVAPSSSACIGARDAG